MVLLEICLSSSGSKAAERMGKSTDCEPGCLGPNAGHTAS